MTIRAYVIYGLIDPRDLIVRYVGATIRSPEVRLKAHIQRAAKELDTSAKSEWLVWLMKEGFEPEIVILESLDPGADWETREQFWIEVLREQLTNMTVGGLGVRGMPEEVRAKISRGCRGKNLGNQHAKGSLPTQALKDKLSALFKGRPRDPEVKARISEGLRQYHATRKAL